MRGRGTDAQPVVFGHSVEGLLRVLQSRMTTRCAERLLAAGLDPQRLLPGYEAERFYRFLEIIADELFPGVARAEALRSIGRLQVDGFLTTVLGRAAFELFRIVGPKRMLGRLTRGWRSANNFVEASSKEVGPDRFEVWLRPVGPYPEVHRGILERALEVATRPGARVEILRRTDEEITFSVEWPPDDAAPPTPARGPRDS